MNVICCDIDGVLADVREYVKKYLPHDWKAYLSYTEQFPPIKTVTRLLAILYLRTSYHVYLVTGRPENNRRSTMQWLDRAFPAYKVPTEDVLMRSDSDHRSTWEIKLEWFRELKPTLILDDDPAVVEAAVKEGFTVLQVHGFRCTDRDMVPTNYLEEKG